MAKERFKVGDKVVLRDPTMSRIQGNNLGNNIGTVKKLQDEWPEVTVEWIESDRIITSFYFRKDLKLYPKQMLFAFMSED